ncbi:MAG: glycosyltransferase family 4 protein [Magnetococcales bacterium]|nr:glycosyltransferase family 4 protein [Magnetococcales bacterium]
MVRHRLSRIKSIIKNEISGRKNQQVHYISDINNWAFKWVAHYVTQGMSRQLGYAIPLNTPPWDLRHQILIFGNRYPWFFGPRERLHHSNKVVVTWCHGDPADAGPGIQKMIKQLPGVFDRVDRVVVTCDYSAQVLMDHGVPEYKLVKIPLGIDRKKFYPVDNETKQTIRSQLNIPPHVFCIGSFQKDGNGWEEGLEPKWIKGPDVFIETMARLKERHDNLMVLLTGPARGYVKQGLDRIGIPYRHTFLEDYFDITPYYHALDLYLIASRGEGGPQALLEGWASGVPLVSTRVGMPRDLILSGENGFLADVEDAQQLATHISTLIENPRLREAFRQKGLQTVKAHDWQQVADAYVDVVRSLSTP